MVDNVKVELEDWQLATMIGIIAYPIIRDIIVQAEIDNAFKIDWRWMVGKYEENSG